MMRLDRMLSAQGAAARADVKKLARRGLITVDGAAERDPGRIIDPLRSEVVLAGRRIAYSEHVYIMMNKPFGVVSAGRDRRDRTVVDLLPAGLRRPGLFPAGRLDRDTTGLIIITDDGDFAHRLLSPASHVWKHYSAQLDVPADAEDAAAFARGVALPGGLMCLPAKLDLGPGGECGVWIREGKYHQIKRMFEARGRTVTKLSRLSVGGLELDAALAPGGARLLAPGEKELAMLAAEPPGLGASQPAPPRAD